MRTNYVKLTMGLIKNVLNTPIVNILTSRSGATADQHKDAVLSEEPRTSLILYRPRIQEKENVQADITNCDSNINCRAVLEWSGLRTNYRGQ